MENREQKNSTNYQVNLSTLDDFRAVVHARSHSVTLNIKKGDGSAGFNPAETLLAALGACLLTNVNAIAVKMHLEIESAKVQVNARRSDDPAVLTEISYRLVLYSQEPFAKLQELHDLAAKWGTVTNTLIQGITPTSKLVVHSLDQGDD